MRCWSQARENSTVPAQQQQSTVYSRGASVILVRIALVGAIVLSWLLVRDDVTHIVLQWLGPEPDLLLAGTAALASLFAPYAVAIQSAQVCP